MKRFQMASFRYPPTEDYPVFAWIWNCPITEALIDRELDEMLTMGIRGVYVIPLPADFRPGKMDNSLQPGYLTEAYFRLIRYAAEGAEKRDMAFWLYDEGGWPSGSAGHRVTSLEPQLARLEIEEETFTLPAGVSYRQGERVLAAFSEQKRLLPGEKREKDCVVTEYSARYRLGGGLSEGMDRRATELFISQTHEKYAKALDGMVGRFVRFMFTDEPNSGNFPWCEGFDRRFEEKYHYSVLPYIDAIVHSERYRDDAGIRARIDYRKLCGELFRKNYLDPIRVWCAEHGMFSAGHLNAEDTAGAGRNHGYGSQLATLRHLDMPGIDLIWRQLKSPDMKAENKNAEIPFFPRIAPSAARQSGGNLSVSESFNIFGAGLTWEQIRYLANYQYVRGINVLNGMSVPAGREKGLALTMRPCYTPEAPGMSHMRVLNEAFARTQYLMRLGDPAGETALYIPDEDLLADGEVGEKAAGSFRELGISLEKQGIDFDYLDDEAIRNGELRSGALCIGKAAYRKVFVPECCFMPKDVREKLALLPEYAPKPAAECDCPEVRIRKRVLPDGSTVYFAFLEGEKPTEVTFCFDENMPGYRLIPENGTAAAIEGSAVSVWLTGGQSCAFLFTNEPVTAEEPNCRTVAQGKITGFEAVRLNAYRIDAMGIRKDIFAESFHPAELGGWEKEFSGEWVYRFRWDAKELGVEVRPGDWFCLKLGKVCYSARVSVNGQEVGVAAVPPYTLRFPAVSGVMTVEIEVANTPANEIVHSKVLQEWPKGYLQENYHEYALAFERESLDGGLYGPVEWVLERDEAKEMALPSD